MSEREMDELFRQFDDADTQQDDLDQLVNEFPKLLKSKRQLDDEA